MKGEKKGLPNRRFGDSLHLQRRTQHGRDDDLACSLQQAMYFLCSFPTFLYTRDIILKDKTSQWDYISLVNDDWCGFHSVSKWSGSKWQEISEKVCLFHSLNKKFAKSPIYLVYHLYIFVKFFPNVDASQNPKVIKLLISIFIPKLSR